MCDTHHTGTPNRVVPSSSRTDIMLFVPGEPVRITGIYEMLHPSHRAPHEAFVYEGENFPRCRQCGENVIFRFVRQAIEPICEQLTDDRDFAHHVARAE